jgi:CRISPR-associated protein Cmr6
MAIAAIPHYLGSDFKTASPGLRFGMYLPIWQNDWSKEKSVAPLLKEKVCSLTRDNKDALNALGERQKALAAAQSANAMLIMGATSIAPFTTGLGNEHPLENGFAFLNPYGLPYLPGSGVKGVLRQAARELSGGEWGDSAGWSEEKRYALEIGKEKIMLSMLDVLFGYESADHENEHVRGALNFWDVIPRLAGNALVVDIMTPHQSHYYQNNPAAGSNTPHESGQPNPICFLAVPPKSGFVFHVQCDTTHLKRLAPELAENDRWRDLMTAAFQHAFEWLGFGAKTAVGYGAMKSKRQRQETKAAQAQALPLENAETWENARVKFNARNGTLSAEKNGKIAYAYAPDGEKLFSALPRDIQQKIKSGQPVKITVCASGDDIIGIPPCL